MLSENVDLPRKIFGEHIAVWRFMGENIPFVKCEILVKSGEISTRVQFIGRHAADGSGQNKKQHQAGSFLKIWRRCTRIIDDPGVVA